MSAPMIAECDAACVSADAGTGPQDPDSARLAFRLARWYALRLGLGNDEANDCAIEFAERMSRRGLLDRRAAIPGTRAAAGLKRCAANWAIDAYRKRARRRSREVLWTEAAGGDGSRQTWDAADPGPSPEAALLRKELCERILRAAALLNPAQRELFEGHFLRGEAVPDLAALQHRTPHAIREALSVIRARLRQILRRQGLDEKEARAYLAACAPRIPRQCDGRDQ